MGGLNIAGKLVPRVGMFLQGGLNNSSQLGSGRSIFTGKYGTPRPNLGGPIFAMTGLSLVLDLSDNNSIHEVWKSFIHDLRNFKTKQPIATEPNPQEARTS